MVAENTAAEIHDEEALVMANESLMMKTKVLTPREVHARFGSPTEDDTVLRLARIAFHHFRASPPLLKVDSDALFDRFHASHPDFMATWFSLAKEMLAGVVEI